MATSIFKSNEEREAYRREFITMSKEDRIKLTTERYGNIPSSVADNYDSMLEYLIVEEIALLPICPRTYSAEGTKYLQPKIGGRAVKGFYAAWNEEEKSSYKEYRKTGTGSTRIAKRAIYEDNYEVCKRIYEALDKDLKEDFVSLTGFKYSVEDMAAQAAARAQFELLEQLKKAGVVLPKGFKIG